jgi:ankyrin repeat protein
MDQVDNIYGYTALILACKNKMEKVALRILECPERCKMDHVNKYCNNEYYREKSIRQYSENSELSNIYEFNMNTALIWACINNMSTVALKLLEYPEICGVGHISYTGNTALIWACTNNMESTALKILEYPEICRMGHINKKGDTALIVACTNNMESTALKILEYPEICRMGHINKDGKTALTISEQNSMIFAMACIKIL